MTPVNNIDFPGILMCIHDDAVLYLFNEWKGQVVLYTLDPHIFKVVSQFHLQLPINYIIRSVADQNCIYIPTTQGEIIGIDKFSGEKVVHCDLGMMTIVSDVVQDEDNLFTVCGVPIMHGLKTDTEILSITSNDKLSGNKVGQSQIMRGRICPITVKHNYIWSTIGKNLYKHSLLCEKIKVKELQFSPNYKTIATEDYICTASSKGALEVFNKDLETHYRIFLSHNNSPPVHVFHNTIYWFINETLYKIDLDKKSIMKYYEFDYPIISTPAVDRNDIYATDKSGNLIRISDEVKVMHVDNTPFRQPIILGEYIILISKEKIYRIEI